jgi:hypothetical protein
MGEGLLEPIAPRLVIGRKFEASLTGLNATQLAVLNQRLDELARCLENNINLDKLDFHHYTNPPKKIYPSTHGMDVWSGDGRRIYGHYEENQYIVDTLGPHV